MRWVLAWLLLFSLSAAAYPQASRTVRIGVFGIFHPRELTLTADGRNELLVAAADQKLFVRARSACATLLIRLSPGDLILSCGEKEIHAKQLRASGRNQQTVGLVLCIPGKIERRYEGTLEVTAGSRELLAVVSMDLETAVASVVQVEAAPGTPQEALKAQAVVSRSYFAAGKGRHADFDFCDLTHCQSLREAPAKDSAAAGATEATQGMVLAYNEKPVAAMFTRSCGGHTRTPEEIGLPQNGYPYFPVLCEVCYRDPQRWTRKVSREDAALLMTRGENGRLEIGRKLGWDAVPSNNFEAREQDGEVLLDGQGQGHGVGLCQRGARQMAENGTDFRAILSHYFPNTQLRQLKAF
jgi:stage II sporulation protein D